MPDTDTPAVDPYAAERAKATAARAKAARLADGFPDDAAQLIAEAEISERFVQLCEAVEASRARYQAAMADQRIEHARLLLDWDKGGRVGDPPGQPAIDPDLYDSHKAVQRELHQFRSYWRGIGQATGRRTGVAIANNTTPEV